MRKELIMNHHHEITDGRQKAERLQEDTQKNEIGFWKSLVK
eukprot:CAMPEP_0114330958 /NCGR_PEP_ID=MMETSP0101-20121206/2094_1 /TAXON_ID=38822 ORGANISM="Pteridomonas danica, Strain PT" /NCGR_SAMPLE_ID=MMETSP0101 /ASSEMBLY_ACC=CAM_ASM_000211 /LENGTH=40 /DNA_ID= /DNA_START= /DNA_END= /DNA_ORIENTATION=